MSTDGFRSVMWSPVRRTTLVGYVEATDLEPVQVGRRLVPRAVQVDLPGADGQPALHLDFAVVDGVPECREVRIASHADGRGVRPADLAAVQLGEWVDAAFALFAYESRPGEDGQPDHWVRVDGGEAERGQLEAAASEFQQLRRKAGTRTVTRQMLQHAADVYKAKFDDHPIAAVSTALGVPERTASRYVKRARDIGLLPPTTPGKKNA